MLSLKARPTASLARAFARRLDPDPGQTFADLCRKAEADPKTNPRFTRTAAELHGLLADLSPNFGATAFKRSFEVGASQPGAHEEQRPRLRLAGRREVPR